VFLTLAFKSLTLSFVVLLHRTHSFHGMAGEADQTLHATGEGVADNTNKTASGAESDVLEASSSSIAAVEKMVN
jgi:hypothetical protein